jgi:hypothetical protein
MLQRMAATFAGTGRLGSQPILLAQTASAFTGGGHLFAKADITRRYTAILEGSTSEPGFVGVRGDKPAIAGAGSNQVKIAGKRNTNISFKGQRPN